MTVDTSFADWLSAGGLQVRRRIRVLMLLDAADYVLMSPISISRFHTLTFLADVLSPIYDFSPISGRVLKRRAGPYFPDLQWEIDRLVGLGLVVPSELTPIVEVENAYIEASLSLDRDRTEKIIGIINSSEEFQGLRSFFRELAGALSSIEDEELDAATQSDVTWERGHQGTIIDYAEWRAVNYSEQSADKINDFASSALGAESLDLSPGARVNLYVQYLRHAAGG